LVSIISFRFKSRVFLNRFGQWEQTEIYYLHLI
jgi:hypothetical protein